MRSFSDTLPRLPASVTDAGDDDGDAPVRFDPDSLLEALAAKKRLKESKGPDFGIRSDGPRRPRKSPFASDALRRVELDRPDRSSLSRSDPKQAAIAAIPAFGDQPDSYEAEIARSVDAARARGDADKHAAVETARQEERAQADAMLEAERTKWTQEIAQDLAAQVDAGLEALHDRIAEALAGALTPVLEEAIVKRAVSSFANRFETLTTGRSTSGLRIKGPQHLLDALNEEWGERRVRLITEVADQPELSVDIADTTLRTSARLWAAAISNGSRHEPK